jgi:hypothetical protein
MRSDKGVIDAGLLLVAAAALAVGVVAGGWKPTEWFRKKPPTAELTKLQSDLAIAQAELARAAAEKAAAEQAERAKQAEQVRYAQQMTAGAAESLSRQPTEHRTPQTQLASDLLKRSELALGLAIGTLPHDKQAEILRIVDGALSSVQAERDAARQALAAKDAELRQVTLERDAVKAELPKLAAKVSDAEQRAEQVQAQVTAKTELVKAAAEKLDAERRKAGSFAAQVDKLWRIAFWIAGGWAFLTFILPGIVKHLEAGRLKNTLRDLSGYAANPLLYHDAKKKLSAKQP